MANNLVYYNQEDPRWRNVMFSNHGDKSQTIGTSACGPTSFAMAASSLIGRTILPPETAAYAVQHGFRTENSGTAWSFFASAATHYGLTCQQTTSLEAVKVALLQGALVVTSMRSGHFTAGGHYILLVGVGDGWFDVYDPNMDNRKYGADGLIDQGVKDDGKVRARESVIQREAGQFWIINKPIIKEEDQPMTAEEKKAFDALTARVGELEKKIPAPAWFVAEFGSADLDGLIDTPQKTEAGWESIAVSARLQGLGKGMKN